MADPGRATTHALLHVQHPMRQHDQSAHLVAVQPAPMECQLGLNNRRQQQRWCLRKLLDEVNAGSSEGQPTSLQPSSSSSGSHRVSHIH